MKPARPAARGRTAALPHPPSTIRQGPGPDSAARPGAQLPACLHSGTFSSASVNWKYIKHGFIKVKHVLKYFAELRCWGSPSSRQLSGPAEGLHPAPLHLCSHAHLLSETSSGFLPEPAVSPGAHGAAAPSRGSPGSHTASPRTGPAALPCVPSDAAQPGQRDGAAASLGGPRLCSAKTLRRVTQINLS